MKFTHSGADLFTPCVETSPDRSDVARLGETIAASLVQAA